jgi:hypothetical protein
VWSPANFLAWRVYQLTATQFAYDFKVDLFQVMARLGVSNPTRMLEKLTLIYDCAKQNQERIRGG